MNFSSIFINRPIATSLMMLAITLFGLLAYVALPVASLPNVDYPTLSVSASLPGASPDTMASSVATPLERQFTMISGLDSMTSTNSMGSSRITLQFDLSRDIDGASVDVQTAISAALPLLPSGMPSPPSFRKENPGDFPVIFLVLTSSSMPMWKLDEYATTMIAQRISTVNGVAQVEVHSSQKYAVRVQLDPTKLSSMQIGMNEVERAITGWNANLPTGTLFGPHNSFNVQANGQIMDASGYRKIVVTYRNGVPVYLADLGKVLDSVEENRSASWLYYRDPVTHEMTNAPGINLMVKRQPKSNVIEVVDEIRKLLPSFNAQLPPSVSLAIRGDSSKNIREAFSDIRLMMGLTAALVILVIFLFLRNLSATLIPSLALPFSIIGTFAVMYVFNFSLNNLSMMALILSIGFVVDDAIVMLENIVRHMERGVPPMHAATLGSKEISFTIVSMTLSLGAVFIPVLFMGGILGRLFREFAVTITVAVLISGLVSVTLTPMLCSRLLRGGLNQKHGRFYWAMEWIIRSTTRVYGGSLHWVLRHRFVMAGVFFAVLGSTFWLFIKVSKGFIPDQDTDQMYVNTEAAQGTSHYRMIELQKRMSDIVAQDPDIEAFQSSAGGSMGPGPGGSNTGRMWVQLKPRSERNASTQQIIERMRPKLAPIPGIRALPSAPQMIRLGGRSSRSAFEFTVQAQDVKELYRNAQLLERELLKLPSLQDVNSDLQVRNPRLTVKIDRDKAAALGLNVEQIQSSLYSAYGPRWVSTIYAPNNQFRVLLELLPEYQAHADLLSLIHFKSADNRMVPLDAVATLTTDASPQTIAHSGQLPSVTISFNLKPGIALGDAVEEIDALAKQVLPANMSTMFTGTAKAFQSSLKNLTMLLIVAIMVVYIVLGVLYESFVQPLTILSGLPSAIFGALLTLLIFNVELNLYAFVGLMMLIGIVKKNAIMQIDFALEAERQHHKSPTEAIYEGCMVRFRPIMMTTMAALLGTLPMSLGWGAGGEARRPLGLAVVGGLVFSQLITLYLTPVVYTYMAALVTAWRRMMKGSKPLAPAPAQAGAD